MISAVATFVLVSALFALLIWRRRWSSDDGFINLNIADNLLSGHGPVFNPGERVEAGTSPAWIFVLALAKVVFFFVRLEWLAVVLGLVLSLAGFLMAMYASVRLAGFTEKPGWVLPAGALIVCALPPFWDFFDIGPRIESRIRLAGWRLSRARVRHLRRQSETERSPRSQMRRSTLLAVLIGLGPLVRPDLGLYTIGLLAVLVAIFWGLPKPRLAIAAGAAFAIPLLYQVFRMGYFATLTPNTALAKEASSANWEQGWKYAVDFIQPYSLGIALIVAAGLIGLAARTQLRMTSRRHLGASLVIVPGVCAIGQALYVVRVGGDFMHGRMFLPAVFALEPPWDPRRLLTWKQGWSYVRY